jgi:hypothetical protein
MGTWSVSLYGNDAAADIAGEVQELLRTPLDDREIVAALTEAYPALDNANDEEHCDLWLAIADQLHAYGMAAPAVLETAGRIIDEGADLEMKRSLGMDDRSLAKRKAILSDLRSKWARPHPKPHKRKIQSQPDAFVFDIGDCVAFPISTSGSTINPYFRQAEHDPRWKPAGFGVMTVLARGQRHRVFAWYAVARLSLAAAEKPSLDLCADAMIETTSSILDERMGEKPTLAVYGSRLTPLFARKMRFEVVGHLQPTIEAIRADFPLFFDPAFVPGACLANELTGVIGTRNPSSIPIARYMKS